MARERQRKSPEERKAQIIRAAGECFMKQGFHKTTIDDIAAKANLAKGTVYLYFRDKEEVFIGFLQALAQESFKELEAVLKSDLPVKEKIYEIGANLLGKAEENPEWNRTVHQLGLQAMEHPKILKPLLELLRDYMEQLEGMVREGINKKELRQDMNPRLAGFMVATVLSNLDLISMLGFDEIDAYDYWRQASRVLFEGMAPQGKLRRREKF